MTFLQLTGCITSILGLSRQGNMFALKRERLLIGRVEATSKQFDYLNQSLALSNTYMFYLLYTLLVSSTVETFNMFIRKGTKCLPQNDPQ